MSANDSTALQNANVDLRICMADVVCPSQAKHDRLKCNVNVFDKLFFVVVDNFPESVEVEEGRRDRRSVRGARCVRRTIRSRRRS